MQQKTQRNSQGKLPARENRGRKALRLGDLAFQQGDHRQALVYFDEAMSWSIARGDSDLWDHAMCNRCAVEIETGEIGESLSELRQIVLRSTNEENSFLAAYNVARAYELKKDHKRAYFYARIARDRCTRTQRSDWLAGSYNQFGNILLAESRWEEACAEFDQALKLIPADRLAWRALILDNLGYCRILQGRYDEGFRLILTSLRDMIRLGMDSNQVYPRLSLAYAYLEVGRLRGALKHGLRALEIAIEYDDHDSIKNAHYLLGETYHQLGHDDTARDYFTRLQQRYYPGSGQLPDLLMTVDVRPLLNLKA